jgi:beta-fructofuranosidase
MNHHFPRYHLRPPRGYLNDPNGPVLVDGVLHLYFQSRPTIDTSTPVQWGHATSTDLVTWQLHRPAMTPVPGGPDSDGCYSGNVIATPQGLKAFYSGYIEHKRFQSVLTALSLDGGFSFGSPTQALPDPRPDDGVVMFRDPFVWYAEPSWRMAVGAEMEGERPAVRLYESDDLESWSFLGNLVEGERTHIDGLDTGAGWECPQVVTVGGDDVVVVSPFAHVGWQGSSVLSLGRRSLQRVDHGSNFYAASVLRSSPHGPIMFGWMPEACEAALWRKRGWAGVISLPRVLDLGSRGELLSDPVPALSSLRVDAVPADSAVTSSPSFELRLPHVSGTARIEFGPQERLEIAVDLVAGLVVIDRDHASVDPRVHRGVMRIPDAFDEVRASDAVRVFVDGSCVEVFTSGGRVASTRVYPSSPPPWSVEAPAGSYLHHLEGRTVVPGPYAPDPFQPPFA